MAAARTGFGPSHSARDTHEARRSRPLSDAGERSDFYPISGILCSAQLHDISTAGDLRFDFSRFSDVPDIPAPRYGHTQEFGSIHRAIA